MMLVAVPYLMSSGLLSYRAGAAMFLFAPPAQGPLGLRLAGMSLHEGALIASTEYPFMQSTIEFRRYASPGGRPQPLAFHGDALWVGSWDTSRLYAIDTKTWSVLDEVEAPGKPYGLVSFGGAIRAVISLGEADDRFFFTFVPGKGFDAASKVQCPDFTGSHLASDGTTLYLAQMTNRRLLALAADGSVQREIPMPTLSGGFGFRSGTLYMLSADEEFDELHLATLDITSDHPAAVPVCAMPAEARSLAFDGTAWWTNLRELNQTASFTL